MATRTRVISQNKAVYVTPTGWNEYQEYLDGNGTDGALTGNSLITGHHLHRVDTFSFEMDLAGARQDVREFGQLARIGTVNLTEVNPTLSFGYFLGDGENELALGFQKSIFDGGANKTGQMCSGQLKEDPILKERNVFLLTVEEGEDAFSLTDATMKGAQNKHDVVGFGNCFVSSYGANFSVGEIPRADIEMQASNVVFYTGINSGLLNPSLNLEGERTHTGIVKLPAPSSDVDNLPLVLRPQDVTVSFNDAGDGASAIGGPSFSALPIQSASIELPLAREVIEALGNELAYAKLLEFPIDVTMSISSLTRDFASGALEYALTGTAENNKTDITLDIKDGSEDKLKYILKGAVLDNQSFSQGLDDNETVDLTFSAQIGGASTTDQGLFFFPQATKPTFPVVSGANNKVTAQPIK
jgi:hypothetical protein